MTEHLPEGKVPLTAGKLKGLRAVSTERRVIAALALDQRGSLADLMTKASGQSPSRAMLEEFKSTVTGALAPYASGILLDLEYGKRAISLRAPKTGLLLTYEMNAYVNRSPHRPPQLIPGLSVKRLKENGAAGVKVLIHYASHAPEETNDAKRAFVERVGAECAAEDIPFFLEVVGYDGDGTGPASPGYARRKPEIVIHNMREFSRPRYQVDVLKIEFPVDLKHTSGIRSFTGQAAYSRQEALDAFRQSAAASSKPFIYLSAGVTHAEFVEGLYLAGEASVPFSGVLCGRAIWQEGAAVYARQGTAALEKWLEVGIQNIQAVNECLRSAHPWKAADLPENEILDSAPA